MKVAATFDAVVDLDLGILKLLKIHYPNEVKDNIMRLKDERLVIVELLSRTQINPLHIILKPEEGRDNDSLFSVLMSNYRDEILSLSTVYDLFGLFVTYNKLSDIDAIILCENNTEAEYIHKLNSSIKTVIIDPDSVNLSTCDALYIKYIEYLKRYKNAIRGVNIYAASAMYNMINSSKGITLDPDLVQLYGELNTIKLIDFYKNAKWRIPIEEGDT